MVTMSNCILNACTSHHKTDVSIDVADQQPHWLLHKGHSFNALSLINIYAVFSAFGLHTRDCSWIMLLSPHLLPFSANWSFEKSNEAKCGQYRGCRTAMPFSRVLMMLYDILTLTFSRLSPLYTLKYNAFQEQVWPHLKACFLHNCHHVKITYTITNPD